MGEKWTKLQKIIFLFIFPSSLSNGCYIAWKDRSWNVRSVVRMRNRKLVGSLKLKSVSSFLHTTELEMLPFWIFSGLLFCIILTAVILRRDGNISTVYYNKHAFCWRENNFPDGINETPQDSARSFAKF